MKKIIDIAVAIAFTASIIAVAVGAYKYLSKQADYAASERYYEELKSDYVDNADRDTSSEPPTGGESPNPEVMEQVRKDGSVETEPLPIEAPSIDWAGLKSVNADIIGWIDVPAVGIEYPVLQGGDNQEYLHQDVSGEWRTAGSIFLDSENSLDFTDPHSIIYGHNMRNGSMFASLKQFNSQDVYESCPYFWICTEKKDILYQIVSVHAAITGDESFTLFTKKDSDFEKWLVFETGKSQIECRMPDRYIKRLLTLSTCTPSSDSTRQLVQAVAVREVKPS